MGKILEEINKGTAWVRGLEKSDKIDDKATVSVSPKILQLDLLFEMFVFSQLVRFLKEQVRI